MKKSIIYLVMLMWAGVGYGQQITELKEARIGFDPLPPEVIINGDRYTFEGVEAFPGEFEQDPLAYLNNYCDMEFFCAMMKDKDYKEYNVVLKSTKGKLKADYDKEGKLVKTSFKLENVLLPKELREKLCRDYSGWTLVENVHEGKGKRGFLDKEVFTIKLVKGNRSHDLKIDMAKPEEIIVAAK